MFTKVPNCATCLRWSPDGAKLSLSCKTGKFLVFDARQNNDVAWQVKAKSHGGPKAQKNCWIDDQTLLTSGFNTQALREYAIWDMRMGNEAVHRAPLGDGAGVAHLYFDRAHGILYAAGRGDMQLGIYQQHSSLPGGL